MDIARQRLTVRHFYEENSADLFEALTSHCGQKMQRQKQV